MFYVKKKKKRKEERMLTDPSLCYSTGVIIIDNFTRSWDIIVACNIMSYCTNRLDLIIKSCTFKKRSSLSLSSAFSFPNNKS